jgi:hypothetical protein
MKHRIILTAAVALGLLALTGCSQKWATSTSDTHVCVFDGSEKGGQRLKFQVPPGAESRKIDDNDQVVRIPASNRFWMVSEDRSVADPGTPNFYTGNAAGGVPVYITGQIRFRFNLELACEWYSKHGRRNANAEGDLGFNVRGDANQGWFRFLNENFTQTMQEVVSEQMYQYQWPYLHYNYPVNADEAGVVAEGDTPAESTRQVLGDALGKAFTDALRADLGGDYFCGIDTAPTQAESCPEMRFQVTYAGPNRGASALGDSISSLVAERQRVEDTRTQLEADRLTNELNVQQRDAQLAAEQSKQQLLAAQVETARLQAELDTAKCVIYAQLGLDCDGHRPPVIVNGQTVPGSGG